MIASNIQERFWFELYLREQHLCPDEDLEWQAERNCYKEFYIHFAWQAWTASSAIKRETL